MASAPQPSLPLFYNDLMPINSRDHKGWKSKTFADARFLEKAHAIPVTVDEFIDVQRHFPVVFTAGENSLPIALMGLNEGVNAFIKDDGQLDDVYLPAYARRYPFMLAKLQQNSDELSLCFDPTAEIVGEFDEGNALFKDDGTASDHTTGILEFCQRFEESGQRTRMFMKELNKLELLMDGEIAITQNDNPDKPFIYRGFRMVDEQKLRDLPAKKLQELHKSGLIMLIQAHLFSLNLMRVVFSRQVQQGKGPKPVEAAAN